jgi:hypothetical protein
MAVEWALRAFFASSDPRLFSGIGQCYPGWSDPPAGVQWSLWHVKSKGERESSDPLRLGLGLRKSRLLMAEAAFDVAA